MNKLKFNFLTTQRKRMKKIGLTLLLFISYSFTTAKCQYKIDSIDACWMVRHKLDLRLIQNNAKTIFKKSSDKCVFTLIDKIADSGVKKNNLEYFRTLSIFCQKSDGYVSEYLCEVLRR